MTDFPFHYKGACTVTNDDGAVDLHNVELWEEQDVVQFGAEECIPLGTRSWHGVARASDVPGRLLALLGETVGVRLADGRLGHAYITGYPEDGTWIVEITGIGPTPNLNMI